MRSKMIKNLTNENNSINYIPLLIGWLLGLASTLFIAIFSRYFRKKDIKKGVIIELKELQLRIAGICLLTTLKNSEVTDEWIKWIRPYFELLSESESFDYLRENPIKDFKISKFNDQEFSEFINFWNQQSLYSETKSTPSFPKISLPYLESNYNSVSLFSKKYQIKLSQLKREIVHINKEFDDISFYHAKTFENISDTNRTIVENNISQIINRIAKKTKSIVKLIEEATK